MNAPLVKVRGPLGEQIVTEKVWDHVLSLKGNWEFIGEADASTVIVVPEVDAEHQQELLKRRSRLRGKNPEGAVKLAGGSVVEARLLFEAEQYGTNREDVLAALLAFIEANE